MRIKQQINIFYLLLFLSFTSSINALDLSAYTPDLIDVRINHLDSTSKVNPIIWGSSLTTGFDITHNRKIDDTHNGGIYLRPNAKKDNQPDVVISVEHLNETSSQWEAQAHVIYPSGFGLGGGFVEKPFGTDNLWFAKFIYQKKEAKKSFIISPFIEYNEGEISPGILGAVYNKNYFIGGNASDEQWRTMLAYISEKSDSIYQPVIEARYIDNTIGDNDGVKYWFVNASLKYNGGFFGHNSRLGRALGPSANVHENPVSYLGSNWNRTADLWETGKLVNFRLSHKEFFDNSHITNIQTAVFPAQFISNNTIMHGLFIGYEHINQTSMPNDDIGIAGYSVNIDKSLLTLVGKHNFENNDQEIIFTIMLSL
jgi:hypothetical protein